MKYSLILILFCLSFNLHAKINPIKSGYWETQFHLDESHDLTVRMFFEDGMLKIKNGDEVIELKDLKINDNEISIPFNLYYSKIVIQSVFKKTIKGYWKNMSRGPEYMIPFTSNFKKYKSKKNKSLKQFNGKWDITLGKNEKVIGEFNIRNNRLLGTFLTETGDFRYLEGNAVGDSMYLTCFDGSHAFLFNATLSDDTLRGEFLSGNHYKVKWFGIKNDTVKLRNPDSITYAVNDKKVQFNLTDTEGVDFSYPKLEKETPKITLIQIFGSWCPNCIDETLFLNEIYEKFKTDIDIIGIGFERGKTKKDQLAHLIKFKQTLNVKYNIVLGGKASKKDATLLFPMLNNIIAFPTLIILNDKNEILRIHTGFSGPATGAHYDNFKADIEDYLKRLLM